MASRSSRGGGGGGGTTTLFLLRTLLRRRTPPLSAPFRSCQAWNAIRSARLLTHQPSYVLLRKRAYSQLKQEEQDGGAGDSDYVSRGFDPEEDAPFSGKVVIGLIIATSVTVFAFKEQYIAPPGFLVSRYPKLKDMTTFISDNFVLSRESLDSGRWWTLIGMSFNHASLGHLGFTMLTLWSLHPPLLASFGPLALFPAFVVGGAAGGWLAVELRKKEWVQFLRDKAPLVFQNYSPLVDARCLGSSAGVLALWAGATVCFPTMPTAIFPIPLLFPAWKVATTFAVVSVLAEVNHVIPGISHLGHLGGMGSGVVFGVILRMILRRG